jgi:putative transcriptional regulator
MPRRALVDNVIAMLQDAGFAVSEPCSIRPKSFDVAARRGEDLVLVKILGNVDSFDAPTGAEMRRLGEYLSATPLVFGLRTRDEELKPGVVYFRHGVPVFSPDTAVELFVQGNPPLIYAAPGGLYVNIDEEVLADEREDRDMSLGKLANELGVSRRTVSKYEDGMNASIEVASELEELFGTGLTSPVNVLEDAEEFRDGDPMPEDPAADPDDQRVLSILQRAGFAVHPTDRSPFEAVGEDESGEDDVLTGHSELTETAEKRARLMGSIGRVTRTRAVYFVDRSRRTSIEGTIILEREEAEDVDDRDEFRDLLEERAESEPA